MYKKVAAVIVLLVGGMVLIGCGDKQHFITDFGVGSNIQRLLISSGDVHELDVQTEVSAKLAEALNSGKYNVVKVETSYPYGYFGNYLGSAEIYYDASGPGDGNHIRLLFVSSPKYAFKVRREEVQNRLNQVEKDGIYDIVKIQKSLISSGSPTEVYYRTK